MIAAKYFLLIGSMLFLSGLILAEDEVKTEAPEAKEASSDKSGEAKKAEENKELLDFSTIKDIIKKDGLSEELKRKEEEKRKLLDQKKLKEVKRFNVPDQDDFWSFFSEYWLVKKAPILKWDFHKPDFEIEKSFTAFLESQGIYEKKVKILFLDSTEISHAALPSNRDEYIFILSLPFIRTLDLSKVEISLLLFEDFIRLRKDHFKKFVQTKELESFLGSNFNGKPFDKNLIETHLKKYDQLLFEKGFSFQDQFETTKEMDVMLKSDLKMWNTYLTLLQKIDELIKRNELYKKYSQIYPSPELQLSWLRPKSSIK